MGKYSPLSSSADSAENLINEPPAIDFEDEDDSRDFHARCRQSRRRLQSILTHVSLLAINILTCLGFVVWFSSSRPDHTVTAGCTASQSLRPSDIQHNDHQFNRAPIYLLDGSVNYNRPPFAGPPRAELLDSWTNLTQNMNLKLQPDELGQFKDDEHIIQLADGSGAYVTLAVHHAIHCINRIHRDLYKDYYYPEVTEPEALKKLKHHTEHCIEWLRQYVQCNADLTPIPMYWGTKQALPLATDIGNHQCADWDSLEDWVEERTFDVFEPGLLVHPIFGNPYSKNEVNKLGIVEDEALIKDVGVTKGNRR